MNWRTLHASMQTHGDIEPCHIEAALRALLPEAGAHSAAALQSTQAFEALCRHVGGIDEIAFRYSAEQQAWQATVSGHQVSAAGYGAAACLSIAAVMALADMMAAREADGGAA